MTRAAPDADASRPPSLMVGVDLGGTKIEAAALDATGRVQARRRIASPRGDYDATIRALAGLIAAVEDEAGAHGTIGIAIPGSISPRTGLIQNANSVWLNGRTLHADLETALDRPVRLANDANCFAISEAVDGAAAGARIVFGVIIGTGCGGGIVIDGRVVDGPRGIGGEWGHNPLPWTDATEHPGPQCWCGRRGCMETWVSGTGMAADHAQITGERATAEEVAERAAHGDEQARATLDRHASRLARGLAQMVNVLDPDVIVLGGGLSKLAHLYAQLPGRMAPWIFADNATVDVRPPRWGDASGVRGAAWLWR